MEPKSHRLLFVCVFKKRDRSRSEELTGGETGRGNVHARGDQRGQFDERRLCTDAWTEVLTRLRFPPPQASSQIRTHGTKSASIILALTDGKLEVYVHELTVKEVTSARANGSSLILCFSHFQSVEEENACFSFLFAFLFIYLR